VGQIYTSEIQMTSKIELKPYRDILTWDRTWDRLQDRMWGLILTPLVSVMRSNGLLFL